MNAFISHWKHHFSTRLPLMRADSSEIPQATKPKRSPAQMMSPSIGNELENASLQQALLRKMLDFDRF